MGVDIYGKRYYTKDADQQLVLVKKWVNKKPQMDWDSDAITEVDKKNYFDALDKFEKDNPGHYFRSNWVLEANSYAMHTFSRAIRTRL